MQAVIARAAGQTLESHGPTIFRSTGQADTTFVFEPGDGLGVVQGFRALGDHHSTLALSGADFGNSLARVLLDSIHTAGGLVIFDPVTNDIVRLPNVTKKEIVNNPASIALHG